MMRLVEGGADVPVPISWRLVVVDEDGRKTFSEVGDDGKMLCLKNSAGTEPHVKGAMKVAIAVRPGCR